MAADPDDGVLRLTVHPRSDDFTRVAQADMGGFTRVDAGAPVGVGDGFSRLPATPPGPPAPTSFTVTPAPGTAPDMAGFTRALGQMEQGATQDMGGFTRATSETPANKTSWFDKMLEPITSYPRVASEKAIEARDQFTGGVRELFGGDPPADSTRGEPSKLYGLGNTVAGAIGYPLAPISAGLHTVVGKPLEENTGLPHQYSEFAAGLALPVIGFSKAPKLAQKIFSPETVSVEAMEAAALIRQRSGLAARDTETTAATLEAWQKPVSQLAPAEQLGIMHYIEGTGAAPATPQLRALADELKAAFELRKQKLQALGSHATMSFVDDFFPHFWKDPSGAPALPRGHSGVGKQGSGASTKARTVPTIADGIAQGLVPLTTNPIEATLRYITSMDKYIASHEILEAAKQNMTIIYRHPKAMGASGNPASTQGIPAGYVQLTGRGSRDATGAIAYAPEDWARIYNNWLSGGFHDIGAEYGKVYDVIRRGTNATTQALLSFSGYHALTMAEATWTTQWQKALTALRHGEPAEAAKDFAKIFTAPITYAHKGRELRDVYFGKAANVSAADREVVDLITQGGGRMGSAKHALDYESSALGDYLTSFRRGRLRMELAEQGKQIATAPVSGSAKVFASNLGRIMDTANKPLFQHYIPSVKNGAAFELMSQWLKFNPTATQAEKLAQARKVVDHVDNRFGEMIHDNIFWNKFAKQSAMVAMLSYSWNVGAWREVAGGVRDMARMGVGKGGGTIKADYAVAMALNWAMMSAMYQYIKTGEAPKDIRDLAAPRSGGIDARSGEPERVLVPGLMKDVFGYFLHPVQEVGNKLNPGVKMATQTMLNSDWRGDPILSPKLHDQAMSEKIPDWLTEYFRFIVKTASPIQVQNMMRGKEEGSNLNAFEQLLGMRKQGRAFTDPEGYEVMMDNMGTKGWQRKRRHDIQEQQRYGGTE